MQSPTQSPTAFILIDIQHGLTHPTYYGTSRSNPNFESNIASLLASVRSYNERHDKVSSNSSSSTAQSPQPPSSPIQIIHVRHHSSNPLSPLYPGRFHDWNPDPSLWPQTSHHIISLLPSKPSSVDALPCATRQPGEKIVFKTTSSAFTPETGLESYLQNQGITQVLLCGLVVDHCVNSSTRGAADSKVWYDEKKKIVLVSDCCAAFGKKGLEAELVHRVHVGSLEGEFCQVVDLVDVERWCKS